MAKEISNSPFDPETILPKLKPMKNWIGSLLVNKKKIITIILALFLVGFTFKAIFGKKVPADTNSKAKIFAVEVDKSFNFPALSNQGKPLFNNKIKMKIDKVEKTNQVIVSDKTVIAKNNKLFLIIQLELKNDSTQPSNLLPGDLIRLSIGSDEENKFAPDLHNNLVLISAISTKLDKIGFVVPETAREFKLYVGELEGKKETIVINFPS